MSSRLDYARAKRLARARRGEPASRFPRPWRGPRLAYPEQFPVTIIRMKDGVIPMHNPIKALADNTAARQELTEQIRAIDFNGHVPDQDLDDVAARLEEIGRQLDELRAHITGQAA
jgi:hypothetical protein